MLQEKQIGFTHICFQLGRKKKKKKKEKKKKTEMQLQIAYKNLGVFDHTSNY